MRKDESPLLRFMLNKFFALSINNYLRGIKVRKLVSHIFNGMEHPDCMYHKLQAMILSIKAFSLHVLCFITFIIIIITTTVLSFTFHLLP